MKNTRKILLALLVVFTLLMSFATITASAAKTTSDTVIYLTPNSNWKQDNARFALYTWDGGEKWFNMTDADKDGIYECTIPAGIENIIFCRMNPSTTANNWDNKWNQTADLKYDGTNNHYTVKSGTWDKGGGTWSLIATEGCAHTPAGEGTVITPATCTEDGKASHTCSKCGETYEMPIASTGHSYDANSMCSCGASKYTVAGSNSNNDASIFGTAWDVSNTANGLAYDEATGNFVKVYENVPAGSYKFKVVEENSWNVCYGDKNSGDPDGNALFTVANAGDTVTITFKSGTINVTVTTPETPADPVDPPVDPGEDPVEPPVETEHVYIIAGDVMQVDSVYVTGVNFLGTKWDVTDENNMLVYNEELGAYVKVYTDVKAGEYHFKVAEDKSWDVSYGDNGGQDNCYIKVDVDGCTVTIIFKDGVPTATVEAPEVTPEDPKPEDPKPEDKPEDPKPEEKPEDKPEDPKPEDKPQETPVTPDEPAVELSFMDKVMLYINQIIKAITEFFHNLVANFKK